MHQCFIMEIVNSSQFVERTRDLLLSYRGRYDVTFLINAAVGLIFCGWEDGKITSTEKIEEFEDFNVVKWESNYLDDNNVAEPKTLNNLVRHIRNSIAHNRFSFDNEDKKIKNIVFEDKNVKNEKCEIIISVTSFKALAVKVSMMYTSSTEC